MLTMRDYQAEDCDAIVRHFIDHRALLLNYATGMGKTIVAAETARRFLPQRVLFLCEKRELIEQAYEKLKRVTGIEPVREMAGFWSGETSLLGPHPIVVATVQTLNSAWGDSRRMHRFNPAKIGLTIIDEGHHSAADSYKRVREHLSQNGNMKFLLLTATPDRNDDKAISYDKAIVRDIKYGTDNGWLVRISQEQFIIRNLDYSGVHVRDGDFVPKELEAILEQESVVQGMVHPSLEVIFAVEPRHQLEHMPQSQWREFLRSQIQPRRTIFFAKSVAQAEMAANVFNRVYPGLAEFVSCKTPEDERKRILDRFHSGATPVICNQGILLEGFDEPAVEVILVGRPTLSRPLYQQMAGRVTRVLPGVVDGVPTSQERLSKIKNSNKQVGRLVDYVGNSARHDIVTALHIQSQGYTDQEIALAIKNSREKNRPTLPLQQLELARKQLQEKAKLVAKAKAAEEARRKGLVAKVHYVTVDRDAYNHNARGEFSWVSRLPERLRPSEAQLKCLRYSGIDGVRFTRGECGQLISELKAHSYHKTARFIDLLNTFNKRHGIK